MNDLTIILLTACRVPEKWAEFHREKLLEAAGDNPILAISAKPVNFENNYVYSEPYGISNIYFQLLRGAKMAKTEFIAVAEDDMLYPKEHFEYRPPKDVFAYNMNRFGVFRWSRRPTYFWKNRMSNSTLVASRELVIEALEERYTKYPDGTPPGFTGEMGRNNIEEKLDVTLRKHHWFETEISIIKVDHELGIDRLARTHRKGMGILRAYEIPHWGKAEDIIKKFI